MARTFPFDFLDKACFAGTLAPSTSFAPTWRLEVTGEVPRSALRTALSWLLTRYPVLASHVVSEAGPLSRARRLAWALDSAPDVDKALRPAVDVSTQSPEDASATEQALVNRFLDLSCEYPLAVTWVQRGPGRGALLLQQHHALADGRAFLDMCTDLVALLDAAVRAVAPPPEAVSFERLSERDVLAASGVSGPWAFARGVGHTLVALWHGLRHPIAPLRCNVGADYRGSECTEFLVMPASLVDTLRAQRKALGLSGNDALSGALLAALGRWSARHGVAPGFTRLLVPVDVRPPKWARRSFANHLSSFQVGVDLSGNPSPRVLGQTVAAQSAVQRTSRAPAFRVLVEGVAGRLARMDELRRLVFEKRQLVTNFSFSNLIPLAAAGTGPDGRWRGQGFTVEALRITTPNLPPQGANTTVVRYGDEVCFNFNYKNSVLDRALMRDLTASFEEAVDELLRVGDGTSSARAV